ncbi:MAG: hypothetical protein JNK56_35485 [Myxococcales bacterium]|nr:hypothetical protein [Myxococcales bacterium]
MASIIIDEIVPTKWRLRLRDADGKTREVEYRAGTPLQLDAVKSTASKASESTPAKERAGKTEKPKSEKPKSEKPARSKQGDTDKARAAAPSKSERSDVEVPEATTTKPDRHAAKETAEKYEPAAKPQTRRRKHDAGPGPGGLVWEETEDDGVTGVRATFARGAFKILHAGGDAYGLFYEWNSGKYQTLTCGSLEALKQEAAQWTEDGKLHVPRSNLGAEAAKVACAVQSETPTPPPPPPTPPTPAVDPEKDKALMQGFEATVQKLLAAKKGSP